MKLKGGNKNMRKTNRFVALLMALILVFSSAMSTAVFAEVNEDVVGTSFEATVGKLKAVGIMQGYPDGTFKPEGEITRAEFAKIAVTALGLADAAEISRGTTRFPDVYLNHWATGFINVAVNRGLIVGYPDGTFRPEGKLTNAEAVTILVRLVGLGPVVDKQGTWPANYIGAASNEGILKGVNVASSTNALRGLTAEMLMNTLTVQKWGATGYDNDGSVSYGKLWDGETPASKLTLLNDNLGINEIEGRLMAIDDEEVTIGNTDYDYVGAAADEAWLFLNMVDAWQNEDDEIIYVVATSKQFFDAIEVDADAEELTLVEADKDYDIASNVVVYIDGEREARADLEDNDYDYAKVVLNDDGDVVAISAYLWDDTLIVEETSGFDVIGFGGDELDVEDFAIVKAGKTISLDDLDEGDILYFNESAEYAVVYNRSVTGEIGRIFTTRIVVNGEDYEFSANFRYLDKDGDLVALDSDGAEQFKDADEDVTIFLNHAGDPVFITGDLGIAPTSSLYAYVTDVYTYAAARTGESMRGIDVVNQNGAKVSYDLKAADLDDGDNDLYAGDAADFDAQVKADLIIKLEIKEDATLKSVEVVDFGTTVTAGGATDPVKVSARFVGAYRLLSSAIIFDISEGTDADDIEVLVLKDADFDELLDADYYVNDKDEIVAIIVSDSDRESDVTEFTAIATKNAFELVGEDTWRLELIVDGKAKANYFTKADANIANASAVTAGQYLLVDINDSTNEITKVTVLLGTRVANGVVETRTTATSVIKLEANPVEFKLETGNVVDKTDSYKLKAIRDIAVGDTVDIIRVEDGSRFADYVVRTAKVGVTPVSSATYGLTNVANTITVEIVDEPAGTYVVRIGELAKTVVDTDQVIVGTDAPFDSIAPGTIVTANLYNLNDMTTVLATVTFVVTN
ncbi:S-layer homology domain-containing protein [Petrocella sp. FN5]|uniref:S-layer homology domain-containing protein n=1 Tax=Petrocella sp. FN5 TaxID=3032002 RepID=UPI0023DC80B7|nr:S-layer homology domain-containing protein [Petrocella sp. FN5]MDF1617475.1 S-layer homology domain-containing protein [Petrocella sp. FN5]